MLEVDSVHRTPIPQKLSDATHSRSTENISLSTTDSTFARVHFTVEQAPTLPPPMSVDNRHLDPWSHDDDEVSSQVDGQFDEFDRSIGFSLHFVLASRYQSIQYHKCQSTVQQVVIRAM